MHLPLPLLLLVVLAACKPTAVGVLRSDESPASDQDAVEGPKKNDPDADEPDTPTPDSDTPSGTDHCAARLAVNQPFAQLRRDASLPKSQYNEDTEIPEHGGRVQMALVAQLPGDIGDVKVDGVSLLGLETQNRPPFEWAHVWPAKVEKGAPFWLNFHTREEAWDQKSSAQVEILAKDQTVVFKGAVPISQGHSLHLSYVTTRDSFRRMLIYLANPEDKAAKVEGLAINGAWLSPAELATHDLAVPARTTRLFEVPLCKAATPGSAFSVIVEIAGQHPLVGTGRIIREHFPIEAWNNTDECPYAEARNDNYLSLRDAGFDTTFVHAGVASECGLDLTKLIGETLPKQSDWFVIASSDLGTKPFASTKAMLAFATGDESDAELYEDNGVPIPALRAAKARTLWKKHPDVATFNGGMTNGNIGSFAGMTDIQGMDFYVAACAPHITPFGQHPPLRGAFDYLRNARNNHMPLPTWLYTQGLAPTWNGKRLGTGDTIHVQPDPQEILVQGYSALAAGAKGLMWFQANQAESRHSPARWQAIRTVNAVTKRIRRLLREGDVMLGVSGSDGTIAEAILSPDAMVLVVINLQTKASPDDVSCGAAKVAAESMVPHWVLKDAEVSAKVPRPAGFASVVAGEVTAEGVVQSGFSLGTAGDAIEVSGIRLSNEVPARVFVLARDRGVLEGI